MVASNGSAKRAKTNPDSECQPFKDPGYAYVEVQRQFEVNKRRIKLPACMMEQEIVDAIKYNDVVMITGDTGCGKSTQVPQFLYENGFCVGNTIIGVTQVRRVACMALYRQVSLELNSKTLVGYQFRFNKAYNQQACKIKFMTDGILLQEIKQDLMCSRYSVLIVDEAHDRNLNCDLLIGILSRVVKARREQFDSGESALPPLKLVIMSATIRAEDFLGAKIFEGKIAHRHIATEFKRNVIHFARKTVSDYVADAYDKVLKIHRRLPPGSVLVFLTGKGELSRLKKLLAPHEKKSTAEPSPPIQKPDDIPDDDAIFELESDDDESDTYIGVSNQQSVDAEGGLRDTSYILIATRSEHNEQPESVIDVHRDDTMVSTYTNKASNPLDSQHSNGQCNNTEQDVINDNDSGVSVEGNPCCTYGSAMDDNSNAHTVAIFHGRVVKTDTESDPEDSEESDYKVELDILSKSYQKLSDIKWQGAGSGSGSLRVIVLHASQTMETQMAAFSPPKDDERVVILSTNVAETAVTLPNIRYVIDCGKEKRRLDDVVSGISRFVICDISKASADQRAGRAGRVGSGHCYRQYTSSVYETLFNDYAPVEIASCNMESSILLLSSIGINNPFDFPFLTKPPIENVRSALHVLAVMGAIKIPLQLDQNRLSTHNEVTTNPFKIPPSYPYRPSFEVLQELKQAQITTLGHYLALLPIQPRFAKMLYCVLSKGGDAKTLRTACCVVSALAFGAANLVFQRIPGDDSKCKALPSLRSDLELFIWLCCRFSQASKTEASSFCRQYGVNEKLLCEVFQQAHQLYNVLHTSLGEAVQPMEVDWLSPLETPNHNVKRIIEDAIVECMVDKVAVISKSLSTEAQSSAPNSYRTGALMTARKEVFLQRPYARHKPECVVYNGLVGDDKIKMQDVILTDASTICTLRSPLIVGSRTQKTPLPCYDIQKDCVQAFVTRIYAPLDFTLGIAKTTMNPEHPLATRVFAQNLCFGHIFPELSEFASSLTLGFNDFLLPAKATGPLGLMLMALRRTHVSSRSAFLEARKKDAHFLIVEYSNLLKPETFDEDHFKRIFRHIGEK
ncbi:putative RNA helicase [Babesia divergens]|uniref:RNA helicase n=1 Tax=Babesia divergens TaxID=32595 RepID=A0AAD9LHA6_BABDI|nr:putative RNA helicase [Babesia divergens]